MTISFKEDHISQIPALLMLEKLGYTFVSAEIEMVPSTYTKLEDEETATKMQKMLDMFEDNDDIQNVWHNWEMD